MITDRNFSFPLRFLHINSVHTQTDPSGPGCPSGHSFFHVLSALNAESSLTPVQICFFVSLILGTLPQITSVQKWHFIVWLPNQTYLTMCS